MADRRGRIAGGWLVLALVVGVVLWVLTFTTVGQCNDAVDPTTSACVTSGALDGPQGIVVWVAWALFAWWCLQRALRPVRRHTRLRRAQTDTAPAADGSTPRIGAHTTVEVPLPDRGGVRLAYAPRRDGRPDPGEVVWAWVPYQEDPTRGKDRPLLIIGRQDAQHLLAMKLTSRSHDRDRDYLALGSGPWDAQGRQSWLDIDQVYRVHPAGIRREASAVSADVFARVARVLSRRYGWIHD
ncbi:MULTISPECIES: type II toxin-antitoxin system PemK/MazF family toxin [unclassified Microbacterium]|uniref:type II toxin-antitoxin system PemK/MazF family toxin n=1 Tax=unclassified Microbacterium TaxID=2609290 RepID=UPI000A9272E6|nr:MULTISPECIES: type II toxin-antitoxin system PemK/MazF family toxin [unclassified Microbacterium]